MILDLEYVSFYSKLLLNDPKDHKIPSSETTVLHDIANSLHPECAEMSMLDCIHIVHNCMVIAMVTAGRPEIFCRSKWQLHRAITIAITQSLRIFCF